MNNENTQFNIIHICAVVSIGSKSAIYFHKWIEDGKWQDWDIYGMLIWDSRNTADAKEILNAISCEVEEKANSYIANDANFVGTSSHKDLFNGRFGKYSVSASISWTVNYKALAEARA